MSKFPDYWKAPINYQNALKDLKVYTEDLSHKISLLDISIVTIQNITYEFYSSNAVKKLLNFNTY